MLSSLLLLSLSLIIILLIPMSDSSKVMTQPGTQINSNRVKRAVDRDSSCPPSFNHLCHCGKQAYPHKDSREQFLVNCSNARFTNTDMLKDLPDETEVLIYTGNMLNELEDNIFGFDFRHEKLNYIDFSNNHITFIKGQTFHRVKNVETLILNFNNMEITDRFERHRIFSNFQNLRHLHLTDAFTDRYNASAYYLLRLEDIFIESNMSKLERLHLEQNEIFSIGTNTSIFCPLRSLRHLYLSDNKLGDLDFRIDCLENLTYIDIRYNMITRLSDEAMNRLDDFVSSGRPLSVNLMDNPLVCDCRSTKFLHWLRTSGVEMDREEDYVCKDGYPQENIDKNINNVQHVSCPGLASVQGYSSSTVGIMSFFIVFMVLAGIVFSFYHKRRLLSLVQPILNDLTRKMGYKGLANEEAPTEVNV